MTITPTPAVPAGGPVRAGRDRPVIFSAPMIRALLDGRKSMTRRVLRPQPKLEICASEHLEDLELRGFEADEQPDGRYAIYRWPSYAVGDRLWVRESHIYVGGGDPGLLLYRATWREDAAAHGCGNVPTDEPKGWRPSIHMPRTISRLTLCVTDVRVERLNDISEADAIAEGMPDFGALCEALDPGKLNAAGETAAQTASRLRWPQRWFEGLWNEIHGDDAWSTNPWVVAVTFTVHRADIDALPTDPQAVQTEGVPSLSPAPVGAGRS